MLGVIDGHENRFEHGTSPRYTDGRRLLGFSRRRSATDTADACSNRITAATGTELSDLNHPAARAAVAGLAVFG